MKKNQRTEILKYLETHPEGITSMTAIKRFGATRLSAIIYDLRQTIDDKYYIDSSERKKVKTRYGDKTSVTVYKLKERGM